MPRPKPVFPTGSKTYMFFLQDIMKIHENGWTPKEIMRLGVLAREGQPQMNERIRELERNNSMLQEKLQKYAVRVIELEEELKRLKGEKRGDA